MRRQLSRLNWIRDNSGAVRGCDSHRVTLDTETNTVSHSEAKTHNLRGTYAHTQVCVHTYTHSIRTHSHP